MSPKTTRDKRMAGLQKAREAVANRRREINENRGGMREVCFSMPACDYAQIQTAAAKDHRSAANFMWHASIMAASQIARAK